ncbi:MAG TPA: MFS transporter [Roseiflexaceae bacterium]|nr:MFS transporter [Roseiflexaceae bacterium]
MLFVPARARLVLGRISPAVWRILLHSSLFGLAGSVADLLFNFYLVSLGYGADTAGLLSTVNRMAGVALGLPIGVLIDRIGARRSLILGVLCYSGGWALALLSGALWALALTQFVVGAAQILALTAVVPLMTGVTSARERAAVFGLNTSAAMIVGLLGSAAGGLLPTLGAALLAVGPQEVAAYRLALTTVVAVGLAGALPVLRDVGEPGRDQAAASAEPVQARISPGRLLRFALPALLLGLGSGALLPFQNLFFRQQFGLSDAAVGAVLAVSALVMGLGAVIGAPISARLGLQRAAAALRVGAVPAMLLMLVPALPPALAGFCLRGLFVAASFPLNDALVMHVTPSGQRGAAMSLTSVLWSLGWAGASIVSGWAQLRWGFGPVILAAAAAYALSSMAIRAIK